MPRKIIFVVQICNKLHDCSVEAFVTIIARSERRTFIDLLERRS